MGTVPRWEGLEVPSLGPPVGTEVTPASHAARSCLSAYLRLASHVAPYGMLRFTTEETGSRSLRSPPASGDTSGVQSPAGRGAQGLGRRRGSGWSRRARRTERGPQGGPGGTCPEQARPRGLPLAQRQRKLGKTQATRAALWASLSVHSASSSGSVWTRLRIPG